MGIARNDAREHAANMLNSPAALRLVIAPLLLRRIPTGSARTRSVIFDIAR